MRVQDWVRLELTTLISKLNANTDLAQASFNRQSDRIEKLEERVTHLERMLMERGK